ncbi:recombinase RecT [Pirellulaceae bacterium SH501]
MINQLNKNPKLALCTRQSFIGSVLDLAAIGLEPDGRRAHLIPYGRTCTYQLDYKGIAELVLRSGKVSHVAADVIRRGDIFVWNKGQLKEHVPHFLRTDAKAPKEAGEVFAAYKLTPADLLGDRFDEFKTEIDIDDIASADDPVTMADKLKRALDSFALEQERAAERLAGMATAKRQEAGDIDQLQGALGYQEALENSRKASSELQAAELQATRFRSVSEANARIEEQIQEAEASGVVYQEDLESNIANARTTVEGLRRRLEAAERQLQSLLQQQKHAIEKQQMLDRLRSQIADPGESPSEERLAELRANELKAIELLNVAATVGQRKGALKESMSLQNESVDVANRAIDIRKFAQEVIGRAQKALPEGPIQIKDGLLVVRHEGRKKEVPFEELSTGQKWRVALQYAVRSVGKGGVIPLCQEAWQSLGPELKQEIAEICRESGVYLISASVEDGGALHGKQYGSFFRTDW